MKSTLKVPAAALVVSVAIASPPSVAADDPANSIARRAPEAILESWPRAIAVGGGVNKDGHATGEATFSPGLTGPHFSVGYAANSHGERAYVEGGANVVLNLAAGVGYHVDSKFASRWGFHVFAGLPLPLLGWGRDGASTPLTMRVHVAPLLLYIEPFYRPEFRRGASIDHEVGLLLKMRVALTNRQWLLPGYDGMAGVVI